MINFKGRHFQQAMILQSIRWYLAYSLNYRDPVSLFSLSLVYEQSFDDYWLDAPTTCLYMPKKNIIHREAVHGDLQIMPRSSVRVVRDNRAVIENDRARYAKSCGKVAVHRNLANGQFRTYTDGQRRETMQQFRSLSVLI
jgi:hypothetical protein